MFPEIYWFWYPPGDAISSIFIWRESLDSRVKVKLKDVKIIQNQTVHTDETMEDMLTKNDELVFQVR